MRARTMFAIVLAGCGGGGGQPAEEVDAGSAVTPDAGAMDAEVPDATPPGGAVLDADHDAVDLGAHAIGTVANQFVYVTNTGDAPSAPLAVSSDDPVHFALGSNTCIGELAPAATCYFAFSFLPDDFGVLTSNVRVGDLVIPVSGAGGVRLLLFPNGPGTLSIPGATCGPGCDSLSAIAISSPVTITATPEPGQALANWFGDCEGTGPTCTIEVTAEVQKTAGGRFGTPAEIAIEGDGDFGAELLTTHADRVFTVRSLGDQGLGPVTVSIDDSSFTIVQHNCAQGSPCQVFVRPTAAVAGASSAILTATATPGGTATMALSATNLTYVRVDPLGAGRVVSSPPGIDCRFDCDETFAIPTVTLTAIPEPGEHVTWSGPCTGTSSTCVVALDDLSRIVEANFLQGGYLSSHSHTFPDTPVGQASAPQTFTVTNIGTLATTVTSVFVVPEYDAQVLVDDCTGVTLGPDDSCQLSAAFRPVAPGPRVGQVTIDCTSGSGAGATLYGNGI